MLERQSSQAEDGFVESKKVSIVFRAELTAPGTSEPRVFHQNENPARVRVRGRGLGNPHLVMYEGLLVAGLHFANSRARPKFLTGTGLVGFG